MVCVFLLLLGILSQRCQKIELLSCNLSLAQCRTSLKIETSRSITNHLPPIIEPDSFHPSSAVNHHSLSLHQLSMTVMPHLPPSNILHQRQTPLIHIVIQFQLKLSCLTFGFHCPKILYCWHWHCRHQSHLTNYRHALVPCFPFSCLPPLYFHASLSHVLYDFDISHRFIHQTFSLLTNNPNAFTITITIANTFTITIIIFT